MLIDSHCHIHSLDYPLNNDDVIKHAHHHDVMKMICIGTSVSDSLQAINFAKLRDGVFASVGLHPCNCLEGIGGLENVISDNLKDIVAIGEIGLDYHYGKQDRDCQIDILKKQIDLAIKYNLPIIFHVRESFDDFWPIINEYFEKGVKLRGVLHSFTDTPENADKAIEMGFYIGVNGFSTFIKNDVQKNMFINLPLENILLETDAPYLTPTPFRGKVNEPAFVRCIASYHAQVRHLPVEHVEDITSKNACDLFNL